MQVIKAIWRTICYPLLYLGMQAVVSVVYALAIILGGVIPNAAVAMQDPYSYAQGLAEHVLEVMDPQIPMLIACALVLLALFLIHRKTWKATGFFRLRGGWPYLAVCFAIGVASSAILGLLLDLTGLVDQFPEYEKMMELVSGGNPVVMALTMALVAPFCEELIFRGLVQGYLSTKMRLPFAILIQALLFGISHMNVLQGAYAFLLGIVLGLLCVWRGSIWAAVVAHVAFNSVSVFLSLLPEASAPLATGILYALAALVLVLFAGSALVKKSKRGAQP